MQCNDAPELSFNLLLIFNGRRPFVAIVVHLHYYIPTECVANAPYSPRRGESAKQRARDRGGIGVLGTISC